MKYKLEELLTIKYGKNQNKVVDENGTIPILGTGGIMGWANQHLYDRPSILIPRKGSISNVRYIDKPFWTVDTLFYSIVNEKLVLPKYLYYKLSRIDFNHYNEGTTIPSLRTQTLNTIEIEIHSLSDQKRIVTMLDGIEEKIELNNQINQTLEEMAQAIFKHWFIDFEFPNENAEPYKSSGGKFVESELGMIPEEWNISALQEFITIKHGYAFKSKDFSNEPTELVVLSPGNFKIGGGFKYDKVRYLQSGVDFPSEYTLHEDDLLVTMTDLSRDGDTLGYPAFIPFTEKGYYLHNQRLGKVIFKVNTFSKLFLYNLFCTTGYRGHVLGTATGTTVKHTAPKRIEDFNFILPTQDLLEKFDGVTKPLYNYISNLNTENSKLIETRDTLLPKLMSGEIRIPDAEQEVEACLQKSN